MSRYFFFASLLVLGALVGCTSSSHFGYSSLTDALDGAEGEGDVINVVDTDGDGIADTIIIDNDGDGIGDEEVPFEPPPVDDGDDPTDLPLRSDSGSCIPVPAKVISTSATVTSLDGYENILINIGGGSPRDMVVDLSAIALLKRVLINHRSSGASVEVRGAVMSVGFCNDVAGSSNVEILKDTCSGPIVDLMSGTGGGNTLDVLFSPSDELRYMLAGSGHCISSPAGDYDPIEVSVNNDSHTLHIKDGLTCL